MSTPALNPLVSKIRGTYPGVYDDMDDAQLTKAVLDKYPQYSDLAAPPMPQWKPPQMNQVDIAGNPQNPAASMAGMAGGSPSPQPASDTYAAAVGGPVLAAHAAMGGAMAAPALWPIIKGGVKVGAATAATEAVVQGAKKLPVVGDYISKIPGIDYLPYVVGMAGGGEGKSKKTFKEPGAPLPESPPPEAALARGGRAVTDPAAGLGEIPNRSPLPEQLRTMDPQQPEAPPATTPNNLDDLLRKGVGNQPIRPGVKMRDQMKPDIPEGHTPVESSALNSYKYDPSAREFHVKAGNTIYTYGDVAPEDAQAFTDAPSKGKAWQAMKNNPLIKKNGTPVKPTGIEDENDLTRILKQSVAKAKGMAAD